jgi:RNA polymerase sigma factor (sigma-70 family)
MQCATAAAPPDYRQVLGANIPTIKRVVHAIARRYALSRDAELDLLGMLYVRLLEDDCRALRQFTGRSNFANYLSVIATRLVLDLRCRIWGKWRPSTEARRFGTAGVAIDRMRRRDGFSRDECVSAMATCHPNLDESAVRDIDAKLAELMTRRATVEAAIAHLAAPPSSPETPVLVEERHAQAGSIEKALRQAFGRLSKEDRQLLRMRFREGRPVVTIAKDLGVDQRALYRRYDAILRNLRRHLERLRVTRADAADVIGHHDVEICGTMEDSAA